METLKQLVKEIGEITTPDESKAELSINNIRAQIKNYVMRNNLKSLVIGISGGLDSSVVAALCQKKYTGIPLIGISIPMSSSTAHKEQAQWVGDNYCDAFQEFKGWDNEWELDGASTEGQGGNTNMISEIMDTIKQTDTIANQAGFETKTFPNAVLQGNIKARMRMITLYDMARKTNGMVLSTDNLSEFQMGFWTICGDVGDFGPIQNVGKGFELPAIAEALGIRKDIISQPPSDGLMVTDDNTDEAQLGANYKEVDTVMSIYLGTLMMPDEKIQWFKSRLFKVIAEDPEGAQKVSNVLSRYETMSYKRNGTINLTRAQIGL